MDSSTKSLKNTNLLRKLFVSHQELPLLRESELMLDTMKYAETTLFKTVNPQSDYKRSSKQALLLLEVTRANELTTWRVSRAVKLTPMISVKL